jgi:hypothetical protein
VEQGIPYKRHDVQEGVRHDQRQDPSGTQIENPEDHAHDRIADERSEALVQVVRAAQECARGECRERTPAQLAQPGQQVPDHDQFLQYGVLRGGKHQHWYRPPHVRQGGRYHGRVDAQGAGGQVEA